MNRAEILTEAERLTMGDRNQAHGDVTRNHARIAKIWSAILDVDVTPTQAALCMAGLKLARMAHQPTHLDSAIDGAAYFAIAGEIATEETACPAPSVPSSIPTTVGIGTSCPSSSLI